MLLTVLWPKLGATQRWGAPEFTSLSSDICPFTLILCDRSRRTSLTHNTMSELTRTFINLWSSIHGFSSIPWLLGSSGGHEGRFGRDPLPVFSAGDHCEQVWHGQECPLFDVVHPAFPLATTASLTLQGVLEDGFGEPVVACDMPESYKFPFLDSCQKNWIVPPDCTDQECLKSVQVLRSCL